MPARHLPGLVGVRVLALPPAVRCADCAARPIGVCAAIPALALARLAATGLAMRIPPGRRFIEERDTAEHFFTLSTGTARLLKTLPNGRQQIISFPGIGDFLGLASPAGYNYAAEAVDVVTLCRFPRAALRLLMADFPAMEKRLLEVTSHELGMAQEQMLLLGRKSALERIASFLLARAGKTAAAVPAGLRVMLPMGRADIADYIGLRIETVSRSLARLKSDGVIGFTSSASVVIRDVAVLERLALCS